MIKNMTFQKLNIWIFSLDTFGYVTILSIWISPNEDNMSLIFDNVTFLNCHIWKFHLVSLNLSWKHSQFIMLLFKEAYNCWDKNYETKKWQISISYRYCGILGFIFIDTIISNDHILCIKTFRPDMVDNFAMVNFFECVENNSIQIIDQ